jgi:Zn-dependent protease with chaperone function
MKNFSTLLPALTLGLCLAAPFAAKGAPVVALAAARATTTPAAPAAQASPSAATLEAAPQPIITKYTLPPDRYQKARNLARIHFWTSLIGFVYGLIVLLLILRWKLGPKYRDWAEHASSRRFVQALIFAPLLILSVDVLELPLDIFRHWISRKFGISVQGWLSWAGDWGKGELIGIIIAVILVWILYGVIRRSPRRWWFYFWLAALPILLFLFFLQPLVIDPLFFKFEPLAQRDPALSASLEKMVQRAGENIPPERMYWMNAGQKLTALNAYVTGLGASKRVVVWDTTIRRMSEDEVLFVTGHEMGHYVLGHLRNNVLFACAVLVFFLYLAYRLLHWMLARWGETWGIRGPDDLASLPALILLLAVFGFLLTPILNAYSRHLEHQADQYGLEVIHGLIPDAPVVAAHTFQILGEVDLEEPNPSTAVKFWFYNHPPLDERMRFAQTYDPWSQGRAPEFVK